MPGGNRVWCAAGLRAASPGSCEDPASCWGLHGAPVCPRGPFTPPHRISAPFHPVSGCEHRKCAILSFLSPFCIHLIRVLKVNVSWVFSSPSRLWVWTTDQELVRNAGSQVPQTARVSRASLRSSHLTEDPDLQSPFLSVSSSPSHNGPTCWVLSGRARPRKDRDMSQTHASLCQPWIPHQPSQPVMAPHHPSFWVRLGLSPSWFIARTSEPLTGGSSCGDSRPGVWKLELHRQECARVYKRDCTVRTGASPNCSEGQGPPKVTQHKRAR